MKNTGKYLIAAVVLLCACAAFAAQDTTLDEFGGDREVRDPRLLKAWLEANAADAQTRLAAVEAGTLTGNLSINGSMTVVSTNDATTNVVITVDGVIDGETIGDDTIDDDSIDFGDVTGADLTLTDAVAVTATGTVQGKELAITEGTFDVVNTTQLVFIASGVTNVIDSDITN